MMYPRLRSAMSPNIILQVFGDIAERSLGRVVHALVLVQRVPVASLKLAASASNNEYQYDSRSQMISYHQL